jgi:hypothetical protein
VLPEVFFHRFHKQVLEVDLESSWPGGSNGTCCSVHLSRAGLLTT